MSNPHSHQWSPIEDLPSDWRDSLVNPQVTGLVRAWQDQAVELRTKDLYQSFLKKLQRRWAIETGILEGLYTLSDGATMTLIEQGLDAALISFEDTNDSPSVVVQKIEDHHQAVMGLYRFVSGKRPLGTSYVKELHQILTAHQKTYTGRDTLGNVVERELYRGKWKNLPNNVEHEDGSSFEYCPPEHVDQEMEHLLRMHEEHNESGVPPDVEAAWLHHRFTLIHPFTDGNGRVARCLATLVLLREKWFPLVVTRDDRPEYIAALRSADEGDLKLLVDMFGDLQRKAIREARSLTDDILEIQDILTSATEKLQQSRKQQSQLVQKAQSTAGVLQLMVKNRLSDAAVEIDAAISGEGEKYKAEIQESPRGDVAKEHYYYHQIIQCAKKLGYFANFRIYRSWVALVIFTDRRTKILFSFHGIGHESSGVPGCAPMVFTTTDSSDNAGSIVGDIVPLSIEPFEFSYVDEPDEVRRRFQLWLDECLIQGLEHWRKSL